MKSTRLVPLMIALACFACRGGDDDGDDTGDDVADDAGDDAGDDSGDDGGDEATIYDVQSDEMAVGTPVTLRGVVVTAVDAFGADAGQRLFVMEPEGGPFSGVLVFQRSGLAAEGVVPGDIVDVVGGVKDEFSFDDDTGSVTEIAAADGGSIAITKTGAGELPAAEVLVPWELAADADEAEKWEGVLVEFANVRVAGELDGVGSDPTRFQVDVTGPFQIQSDLTSFDGVESGKCYSSVTGVGDYFYSYKILPRSAEDLVVGEDGDCLPPEDDAEQCGDETDNDYNGLTDCLDPACIETVAECAPEEVTIEEIRTGEVEEGTRVTLTEAIVVGVSAADPEGDLRNRTFWVQDGAAGAVNTGIAVFWPEENNGPLPDDVVVGATLTFDATVDIFPCIDDVCETNPVTQLNFASEPVAGDEVVPTPLAADLADIAVDPAAGPFVGTLITIGATEVVSAPDEFGVFSVGDGTDELIIDNDIFEYEATEGECFTSMTGVFYRSIFSGSLILLPRSADDVVTGACP